jgi:hypothetical protein
MTDAIGKEKPEVGAGVEEFWFTIEIRQIWVRTVRVLATDEEAARSLVLEGHGEGISDDEFDCSSMVDPETWVVKKEPARDTDRRTLKIGIGPDGRIGPKEKIEKGPVGVVRMAVQKDGRVVESYVIPVGSSVLFESIGAQVATAAPEPTEHRFGEYVLTISQPDY